MKFLELELNESLPTVSKPNPHTYKVELKDLEGWKDVALYKMSLPYLFKNITAENNLFYISFNLAAGDTVGFLLDRLAPGFYDYDDLSLAIKKSAKEKAAGLTPPLVLPDDFFSLKLNLHTLKVDIRVTKEVDKIGINPITASMLGFTNPLEGNFLMLKNPEKKIVTFTSEAVPDITNKKALIITDINWVRKQFSNHPELTERTVSVESLANYQLGGMINIDNSAKLIWFKLTPQVKNSIEISFSTGEQHLVLESDLTVNITLILR